MEKGNRQNGSAGQVDNRDLQPAPRPAPGKVTRTSKLSPDREPAVQRKLAPTGTSAASRPSRSRDGAMDAAMDAAHRGVTALAERGGDAVQARGDVTAEDPAAVRRAAATGVSGAGGALPHGDRIQAAFGTAHDLGGVRAHVGGEAAAASEAMGAQAYATGNSIAFQSQPDLHTAAHEAAHVVQQRAGVQLAGGVGRAGDSYERQADAVADAVVRGESAAPLLGPASSDGQTTTGVQRQAVPTAAPVAPAPAPATAEPAPAAPAPLSMAQRNALHTLLASRLGSAFTKYAVAAEEVNDKLEAEAAARVELVMTLLGVGFIFVAPGMANAIRSLANQIPAGASTTTYRVALGIMGQADQIAGTMAEVGKTAAKPAVSAALANGSEDYLAALSQGFSLMVDQIVGNVAANIENTAALPDERLWLYVSQWDPQNVTQGAYESQLLASARAFRRQVEPIGTPPVQEMGGANNLGRDTNGQWHLYEEYSRGRYMRGTAVSGSMLESALRRSFAEFQGPWSVSYIEDQIITGGETASMYRQGDATALRREFARFNER
jgi:hypothetical protein